MSKDVNSFGLPWNDTASELNSRVLAGLATGAVMTGAAALILDSATVVEIVRHAGEIWKDARAALQVAPIAAPAALSTIVATGWISGLRGHLKESGGPT